MSKVLFSSIDGALLYAMIRSYHDIIQEINEVTMFITTMCTWH